jgi:hypothetical protein
MLCWSAPHQNILPQRFQLKKLQSIKDESITSQLEVLINPTMSIQLETWTDHQQVKSFSFRNQRENAGT